MSESGILRASGGAHRVDAAVAMTTKGTNIEFKGLYLIVMCHLTASVCYCTITDTKGIVRSSFKRSRGIYNIKLAR